MLFICMWSLTSYISLLLNFFVYNKEAVSTDVSSEMGTSWEMLRNHGMGSEKGDWGSEYPQEGKVIWMRKLSVYVSFNNKVFIK